MADVCTGGFSVNPDISGIGVRLSFYLQNILSVLLVTRSWQDAPGALWTFIATSFGLTISAIVQSKQGQLSFFQAVQVCNLVWMANFGLFLALASYSRHRKGHEEDLKMERSERKAQKKEKRERREKREEEKGSGKSQEEDEGDNLVKYAAMIQMFISMGLTYYIWTHQDAFGDNGGPDLCAPSVKYVAFFAADFPARTQGRKLALAMSSILTIAYTLITAFELVSLFYKHTKKHSRPRITVDAAPDPPPKEGSAGVSPDPPTPSEEHSMISEQSRQPEPVERTNPLGGRELVMPGIKRKRQRRAEWSPNVDPMLVMISILELVFFVYFVVSTELLLSHNPEANESANQWAFGQILALILVVPSCISVFGAFREHGFHRLHHRGSRGLKKVKRYGRVRDPSTNV